MLKNMVPYYISKMIVLLLVRNKDISVQLIFLLRFAGGSLSSQACVKVITAQSTF